MLRRSRQNGLWTVRDSMLAVPSRVAQRLPHITPHDVAELRRGGQGGADRDQPLLGVPRDSKKAPNKNIDPDIPGTHTGPLKVRISGSCGKVWESVSHLLMRSVSLNK
jgi:hypothetical protein